MKKCMAFVVLILVLAISGVCVADEDIKATPINGQPSHYVKLPGNGVVPQVVVEPKPEEQVVKSIEKEAGEKVGIEKEPEKGM